MILAVVSFLFLCLSSNAQITFGEITDSRDGQTYRTVTIRRAVGLGVTHSHTWMAENLNYKMEGTVCYEFKESNCEANSYLYTWDAAMKACPSGWHLPSTVEWERLIHQFDNLKNDLTKDVSNGNAFEALTDSGSSGFNATFGGIFYEPRDMFYGIGELGSYWTSSEGMNQNGDDYWEVTFDKAANKIRMYPTYDMQKGHLSCRCVKD